MPTEITLWTAAASVPILSFLTGLPLLTATAILYCPKSLTLRLAFGCAIANVLLSIYLLVAFDSATPGIQLVERLHFLGLSYQVGVDGANILFIPLCAILCLLALVYTLITRHRNDHLFVASLLAYQGILIGAFAALNAMQFWLWTLLEIVPVAVLTRFAGTGQQRHKALITLLQFWLPALAMSLLGFAMLGLGLSQHGLPVSFDWLIWQQHGGATVNQNLIFLLLFYSFAVRMPLFPFHSWLPRLIEHGTVASAAIFLVGLKLGIYAVIRFILPIIPDAAERWEHLVIGMGLISIFYGALQALMQINIRRLMAFAVLSHTGLLIIGLFSFNSDALQGGLLLSIAYGLATAGMLFSVGLIYERTRTAFLPRLGGLFDSNATIGLLFMLSALCTMVMPGTPGFDAAHLLIEGAIAEQGWGIAIAILIGNVLAAAFLLWAFQRIFIAHPRRYAQPYCTLHHPVIKERIIAITIGALLLGIGFYTAPWLRFIDQKTLRTGNLAISPHSVQVGSHD